MHSPDERLVTVVEVCEMLGISDRTLRRWCAKGILPVIRIGGVVRFRPSDIERAISDGTHESTAGSKL